MTGPPAITDSIAPYDFAGTASTGFANPLNTDTLADGTHTSLELMSATIANGMTAIMIILAMCCGVIAPKMVIDRLGDRATRSKA